MTTFTQELNAEEIAEILAGSRQRGVHAGTCKEFLASEMTGAKVSLTEGTYAGKKSATVYAGITSAVKAGEFPIQVVQRENQVFLLRKP